MTHLDIWNTSYGQKKGQKSNWQFDSQPLKIKNCLDFLARRWRAIYHWKALDEEYNFSWDLISIGGLHAKLRGPKVTEVLILGILNSHLEVPGQNAIWMWASWRSTKYTIRGKVMASPKSKLWWILWVQVCPCFILAPKCFDYVVTNLLFGLCRPVWVSKLFVNLPSLILELQHAPPQNATSQGTCPNSLLFQCFHFRFTFEPIKELGNASKNVHAQGHVCY